MPELPCAQYDETHFTFIKLHRENIPILEYVVFFTDICSRNPWTEKIGHIAFCDGQWWYSPKPIYELSQSPNYLGIAGSKVNAANKLVQEVCK